MKKTLTLLCFAVLVLTCLAGCGSSEREYHDEIVFPVEDSTDLIIIKEWHFLLGSGADVYYKKGNEKPVLLGKTTGGEDGFCPFEAGLYTVTQDGNSVRLSWCFDPSSDDRANWRSKSFELPR